MVNSVISQGVYHMKSQMADKIKKLNQVRNELEWSQQKLATELGVSISTVVRWESGNSNPGNLAMEKIGKFLRKQEMKQKEAER